MSTIFLPFLKAFTLSVFSKLSVTFHSTTSSTSVHFSSIYSSHLRKIKCAFPCRQMPCMKDAGYFKLLVFCSHQFLTKFRDNSFFQSRDSHLRHPQVFRNAYLGFLLNISLFQDRFLNLRQFFHGPQ